MENKEIYIDTPSGRLSASITGTESDYPGIYITLETPDSIELLAVVEHDTVKGKLQTVVYADDNIADEPSHIIPYNFIKE